MTPAAHIQSAIELLELVETSNRDKGLPLETILKAYFRQRRYAGSRDRRAIRDALYSLLRTWGKLRWWANEVGLIPSARNHALAYAANVDDSWLNAFGAAPYGPPALDIAEMEALGRLTRAQALPDFARANVPTALFRSLNAYYGDHVFEVLSGLDARAETVLRVKSDQLKATEEALEAAGFSVSQTQYARSGLKLQQGARLTDQPLYLQGAYEVQDEASQLCAAQITPPPGALIIDLCAGAGGKTLALAHAHPKARILACDTSVKRLAALKMRAERAGAANITIHKLPDGFPDLPCPELLERQDKTHWVLIDAPCSSSGTWRRHPELRWRYDGSDIRGFAEKQVQLAQAGRRLLKSGGRLTFATCSIYPEEGEQVIEALMATDPSLKPIDYRALLERAGVKKMPDTLSNFKEWLLLSPHRHGCDGFFTATLSC